MSFFRQMRVKRNQTGASLLEMSLLCAGIAVVAMLAVSDTGAATNEVLCGTTNSINRNGSTALSKYAVVNGVCRELCLNPFLCGLANTNPP